MSDYVMVDGDTLHFDIKFGDNTVTPTAQCLINGSGEASIQNKKICILGDEKKVSIAATYFSESFPITGTGNITISSLAADQQVAFAIAKTPLLVVGSQFKALFTPVAPASDPKAGPAPLVPAAGNGTFSNSQTFVKAG